MIKYNNFVKSLNNLKEVLAIEKTAIVRDSSIKRYELCYELAWKSIQELLKNQGLEICLSPKQCFKQAFRLELIANEDIFADMVKNKNLTTHTYDDYLANNVYENLSKYFIELENLSHSIQKMYNN